MRALKKLLLWAAASLVLLLLAGPFLVPVPALEGTLPVGALADADGKFVNVNGVDIHYKSFGQGEPVYLLMHGFAASVFSWREVMGPLASRGRVIAYDRPAFGLSERPLEWGDWNPYGSAEQVDIALALMDALGVEKAVVVGNSAGGAVAAGLALQAPERVSALVLVSPAIQERGGAPGWLRPLLRSPQLDRLGPLLVRSFREAGLRLGRLAWHDPERITPQIQAGYELPLQADDWDRGLWNFISSSSPGPDLVAGLAGLQVPVLVVTGDDDRVVPTASSVSLAAETGASLEVIPACGHIPQEECPGEFLAAVDRLLDGLGAAGPSG